jgi:starch-binding outer membrane protein, SusD/RagB family
MRKNKFIYILSFAVILAGTACKKQLQVGNPNAPTIAANVNTESGLIAFAQGSIYVDGFQNGEGWLGNTYFSLPYGYSELLADMVGADAANQQISVMSVPELVTTEDGTKVTNPNLQIPFFRTYNTRANTGAGANVYYYQWLSMYALNNACNTVLNLLGNIPFSGDTLTKRNTVRAWCYWWKGYAYAAIGSQYYSGLVIDTYGGTSNHYLTHDSVIAQSNYYFNQAISLLTTGVPTSSDYTTVLGGMIPSAFQTAAHGGVPTPAVWIRNINTMLARNLLLNKLNPFVNGKLNSTITKSTTSTMTTADWNAVLTYATSGIQKGDIVFSGISAASNSVFTPLGGTVSALSTGTNSNTTFKVTERFIQNFKLGDKRLSGNFVQYPSLVDTVGDTAYTYFNPNFATRWNQLDRSLFNNLTNGVYVYGALGAGDYELYIAGSYEENALMLAEANIMMGNTDAGLAFVDAVRTYQGSGVAAVSGTGLTQTQGMAELIKERRVALVYRGTSFYDSRRWGWIYDIANGGGSYGNTFLTVDNKLYTNTTINYNFLDYWDVPADESVLNPPGTGSSASVNPNF